jgi:hypothetical protein
MNTLLTATALILSMTAAASAAEPPRGNTVLSGGPLYTPGNPPGLLCEYINLGAASVTPTAQQIFEAGSTTEIASSSTCATGNPVASNQTCLVSPKNALPEGLLYSCKLIFSTTAAQVRGSLQVFENSEPSASVELR